MASKIEKIFFLWYYFKTNNQNRIIWKLQGSNLHPELNGTLFSIIIKNLFLFHPNQLVINIFLIHSKSFILIMIGHRLRANTKTNTMGGNLRHPCSSEPSSQSLSPSHLHSNDIQDNVLLAQWNSPTLHTAGKVEQNRVKLVFKDIKPLCWTQFKLTYTNFHVCLNKGQHFLKLFKVCAFQCPAKSA